MLTINTEDYDAQTTLRRQEERAIACSGVHISPGKATCRRETTVRQWLSSIQTPNELVKKRISAELNVPVDELFPKEDK